MSLKIVIDGLKPVSNEVWEGTLSRKELGCLNSPALREGEVSVLIVRNPTVSEDGRLEFSPQQAPVINLGDSDRVMIIAAQDRPAEDRSAGDRAAAEPAPVVGGEAGAPGGGGEDRAFAPDRPRPAGLYPVPDTGTGDDGAQREGGGPAGAEPLRPWESDHRPPGSF